MGQHPVLVYILLGATALIEGAIFYSIPWQVVGAEFIRALGQLFPQPSTQQKSNEL